MISVAVGFFLGAATAHAHPGHGDPSNSTEVVHYLTEPMHLGFYAGLSLVIVMSLRLVIRKYRATKEVVHRSREVT